MGEVFSVPVTGGSPTILASFYGYNGEHPEGGLTLSGNTLYGTTTQGGAYTYYGTVFSVPVTGGAPTVLASFGGPFNDVNGDSPEGDLTLSGNTLYGTTYSSLYGGPGYGGVFSVPVTGGSPTVLASFNDSDGAYPTAAGLTLSGNTLYGTTAGDGVNNLGTVFSLPVTGGTPTVLASFNGSNGSAPECVLTLSGNTLYGTTSSGGADGYGTVFSIQLPEPSTLGLMMAASLALLCRRRRRVARPHVEK